MKTNKAINRATTSVLLGLFVLAVIVFIPVLVFAASADGSTAGTDGSEQTQASANAGGDNSVGPAAVPDGSGTLSTFLEEAPASAPDSSQGSIESAAPTATDSSSADTAEQVDVNDSPAGNDNAVAVQSEATSDNGIESTPAGQVQNEGNSYFATITPDGLVDGDDTGRFRSFTVTFTELSLATTLGSARVEIPAGFILDDFDGITFAPPGKNWAWGRDLDGYFVYLWALDAASYLVRGESVSATFTATTPAADSRGIYTFTTAAWTDAALGFNGVGSTPNSMATGYRHPSVIVGKGIGNAAQLAAIGNSLGGFYVQTAHIDLKAYLAPGGAGYNDGKGWIPIGSWANPFMGAFNGNGFEISNLTINRPAGLFVGLFGRTNGATLENITLTDVSVVGGSSTGALIGLSENSSIRNVTVSGAVTGQGNIVFAVGGLVGESWGGTIVNSYSHGAKVTATSTGEGNVVDGVGGLAGYLFGGTITNSHSQDATVTGEGIRVGSVGGLVGYSDGGAIYYSHSQRATVTSKSNTSVYGVGGLVGYLESGTITNSYSVGAVTVKGSDVFRVGGLVGNLSDGTIEDSYSDATVTIKGGDVYNVGGLVGNLSDGTITNCYSRSAITVTGVDVTSIGGLVGEFDEGTIANSYSAGAVTVTGGDVYNVGGLVGGFDGGTVVHSYWDTQSSGQETSAAGIGKTTAEMKNINTFAAWDIVLYEDFEANPATWFIKDGEDYPRLWWQYIPPDPDPAPVAGIGFALPAIALPDLPVAMALSLVTGGNAHITPAFILNGSWSELAAATSAYRRVLQQFEAEQEGLSPELVAFYEIELAIAWAAILAREAGLLAEGNQPYNLAALEAAYRAAQVILQANRNLLTTAQAAAADLLMEAIAEVITDLGG